MAIKRQSRFDSDGIPVTVYFRDSTVKRVYRYDDNPIGGKIWLYDGDTDTPLAYFYSVSELEKGVSQYL